MPDFVPLPPSSLACETPLQGCVTGLARSRDRELLSEEWQRDVCRIYISCGANLQNRPPQFRLRFCLSAVVYSAANLHFLPPAKRVGISLLFMWQKLALLRLYALQAEGKRLPRGRLPSYRAAWPKRVLREKKNALRETGFSRNGRKIINERAQGLQKSRARFFGKAPTCQWKLREVFVESIRGFIRTRIALPLKRISDHRKTRKMLNGNTRKFVGRQKRASDMLGNLQREQDRPSGQIRVPSKAANYSKTPLHRFTRNRTSPPRLAVGTKKKAGRPGQVCPKHPAYTFM